MFCAKCGAENPDGTQFCSKCGAPLAADQTVNINKDAANNNQQQNFQQGVVPPYNNGVNYADQGNAKLFSILAYLFWPFIIVGCCVEPEKNNPFVKNHMNNALVFLIIGLAVGIIAVIPIIGWIVGAVAGIALLVFEIMAIVAAAQGNTYKMPLEFLANIQLIK